MDTPSPSDLVDEWMESAEVLRLLSANEDQLKVVSRRVSLDAGAAILEDCARELQASLEAMQKEGVEWPSPA